MRRHSFLSSYKFLVIVLYVLISITRKNGIVRSQSQCPKLPEIQKPNKIVGYYVTNNIISTQQRDNIFNSINNGTTILTHMNYVVSSPDELQSSPSFTNQTINDIGNLTSGNRNGCQILLSFPLSKLSSDELNKLMSNNNSDFVIQVSNFVDKFNINGVDLEYPYNCSQSYNESFTKLLGNLRNALGSKILTITMGPLSQFPQPDDNSSFDFINVMAFQLNNQNTNQVSLSSPYDVQISYQSISYQSILSKYNNTQIIFGVDFGGILETVSLKNNDDLGNSTIIFSEISRLPFGNTPYDDMTQPWSDPCQFVNPNYTSLFSFREMLSSRGVLSSPCEGVSGWRRVFDNTSQEPYLYKNYSKSQSNQYYFISYEDPQSLHQKIGWAVSHSYGGVAIADLSKDTDSMMMLGEIGNFLMVANQPIPGGGTSTPSPNPTSPFGTHNNSKNSNLGLILGVTGGVLLLLVLSSVIVIAFIKKKGRGRNEMSVKPSENRSSPLIPPVTAVPTTTELATGTIFVTALYDFEGKEDGDLSFKKGDRIEVIERGNGPDDWWLGKVNGVAGEFPGNYVIDS